MDPGILFDVLSKNKTVVANMGAYETISRQAGTHFKGLCFALDLLEALVKVQRGCEIHQQPLRQALTKLLSHNPDLNVTKFTGDVWVNLRIERFTAILTHCRREARLLAKGDTHKLVCQLTGGEAMALVSFLKLIELPSDSTVDLGKGSAVSLGKGPASQDSPPRKLKVSVSNVSVDSAGFPKMLESPAKSLPVVASPRKRKRRGQSFLAKESDDEADLQAQMGFAKASKDDPKPKKKAKTSKKVEDLEKGGEKEQPAAEVLKKPAAASCSLQKENKSLKKENKWEIHVTYATSQSYIQTVLGKGRKVLLVALSKKWNHSDGILAIHDFMGVRNKYVFSHHSDIQSFKDEVLEIRKKLMDLGKIFRV